MSVNKVILVGRLGQNPEVRYTAAGSPVANFNLATNETWLDKSGQKQEKTEWHRVVVFGKIAELCGQYLTKGRQVYLEGKLQTRQWQDKEGQTRYTTEVQAQTVQFLGGQQQAGQQPAGQSSSNQYGTSPSNFGGANSSQFQGNSSSSFDRSSNSSNLSDMSPFQDHDQNDFSSRSGQIEPSFTEDDIPF